MPLALFRVGEEVAHRRGVEELLSWERTGQGRRPLLSPRVAKSLCSGSQETLIEGLIHVLSF